MLTHDYIYINKGASKSILSTWCTQ